MTEVLLIAMIGCSLAGAALCIEGLVEQSRHVLRHQALDAKAVSYFDDEGT